jgi:hypothetical protein
MRVNLVQATLHDLETVSSILHEAAVWLREREMPLWRESDLLPERLRDDVANGL